MTEPTTERLAKRLEQAQQQVTDPGTLRTLNLMIEKARQGYYDDYRSPLVGPIGTLVQHCTQLGLNDVAQEAMAGAFDGTKEEADAWMASQEGQETVAEFGPMLFGKGGPFHEPR